MSVPSPGDILAGKYRVERVLGQGGMGVVVQAMHVQLEERVAMKFLLPEYAEHPEASTRFLREARAAVKIKSEHVARVVDVGTLESGAPYMVMEYLKGHDLSDEVEHKKVLDVEEAVDFVLQACEAIAEAHAAGIVHRDLKPANLFLTQRADGSRIVKVLDFGISKVTVPSDSGADMSLTKTATAMGSPLYMSPEQMRSARDVDARSDIWALGAILYELVVGHGPFLGESLPELCSKIISDTPASPSSLRPGIPTELDGVILKCLEKRPDDRYPTVAEFSLALVPFGSKRARTSAERVSRVMSAAGLSQSASDLGALATDPPPPPVAGASTAGPWGNTASGVSSGGNKVALVATVGTLLVVAAGAVAGVSFWSSSTAEAEPEPAAALTEAPSAAPEPSAASAAVPKAEPVVDPPAPPASATAPAPSASAAPDVTPNVEAAAVPAPAPAPRAAPKPRWKPKPRTAPKPAAKPAPPPPPQPAPAPAPTKRDRSSLFGDRK